MCISSIEVDDYEKNNVFDTTTADTTSGTG